MGLMKYEDFFVHNGENSTDRASFRWKHCSYTDFSDIPVCLYLPKGKSERQRPATIYIHGGAFSLGSCSKYIF